MFVFDSFSYLYKTIKQQCLDEITVIKQIILYYNENLKEKIQTKRKIDLINKKLQFAQTYTQWNKIAQEYDQLESIQENINQIYSPYYDYSYIQQLIKQMCHARKSQKFQQLIGILRSHSYRNIGNMNCPSLYRSSYNSSKKLLQEFQNEVIKCLKAIKESDIGLLRKMQFFGEMRHAIGRTALLLSGGAILGMYHIGVVQALMQADCIPKIIAGSSAGSIIAAFISSRNRMDFFDGHSINFKSFINKKQHSLWKKLKRIGKQGYVMDIKVLETFLKDNIGNITFQQAFDQFGWILNITVTGSTQHSQDRLLNYLTAPNVLIWSASAASCAIPLIYGATDLYCKNHQGKQQKYTLLNQQFLDGSIAHDLPMNKLSVFFNVNNFIVSQTNPWVIPFMDYTEQLITVNNPILVKLLIICHRLKQFWISQIKHRAIQLSYIFPNDITKFMNILTQVYVGNITIWPVPSISNYLRILQNPTDYNMILNFVKDGKTRTYPKICQIKSSLFFQKEICNCYKKLQYQSKLNFFKSNKEMSDADDEQFFRIEPPPSPSRLDRNRSFIIPRQRSY